MFKRHMFKKAAIIGTGLLGGSLALALKEKKLVGKIVGTSRQESSLKLALERGVIDEPSLDISKAIQGADLVVLATPVKVILEDIQTICKHLRRGCLVTDVGSTKSAIVEMAEKSFPPHVLFAGSHPMAGSEKSGVKYATADLFNGADCIVTSTDKTPKLAKDRVKQMWTAVGAHVKLMDPAKHDETLAFVSHLPHLMAFGLMRSVPDQLLSHSAAGLRDTTRIAGSSARMWSDVCLSNYRPVLKAMDEAAKSLAEIRKAIVDQDEQALAHYLNQARAKREKLEKAR